MGRRGERTYVVFESTMIKAGLGPLWERAKETSDTRELVDEIARRMPERFPEGYLVGIVADLASLPASVPQAGIAVRIIHDSFEPTFSIPLAVPEAP